MRVLLESSVDRFIDKSTGREEKYLVKQARSQSNDIYINIAKRKI
jgi:hypothetical protein